MVDAGRRSARWPGEFVWRVPLSVGVLLCALMLSGAASAETWRGLTVAPEHRCSPYERDEYPYPQSVERDIVSIGVES